MNAIIIDDELHCREVLVMLLEIHCPQVKVIAMCSSADEGLDAILSLQPQLIFLDIEMPGGNGFDMLRKLSDLPLQIVFTTAFNQYAIKAIKLSALDYLLKPIDGDELKETIAKAEKNMLNYQRTQLHALQQNLQLPPNDFKIMVGSAEGPYSISPADILYCEGQSNYTLFVLTKERKIMASKTLLEYENQLAGHGFMRVHKSYLVNLKYVLGFNSASSSLQLYNGKNIDVSRRRRDDIRSALFNK